MKFTRSLLGLTVFISGCPVPQVIKPVAAPPRIEALLINGGHRQKSNYNSHLVHIRRLAKLLRASGITKERITILASDGQDETADLAVREPGQFRDHWLTQGTDLGKLLGPPVQYINSAAGGFRLLPAKKAALQTWSHLRGGELGPGDTLLVYVTDHGFRDDKVNPDATIALWNEKLPVSELIALLDGLDPGVRVVLWMSQCYSGAFVRAIYQNAGNLRGNVCGFFSTTKDRVAWGCYPEARDDQEGLGHSMRFLDELRPGGRLGEAHDRVVVTDRTPDIPHRSSDHYLMTLVEKDAKKHQANLDEWTDKLLLEAWKDESRWSRQLATLDRLSRRAGLKPPRFFKDLTDIQAEHIKHRGSSRAYKKRWAECLGDLKRFNMKQFTNDRSVWQAKTLEELMKKHGHQSGSAEEEEELRVRLIEKLISEFDTFVRKNPEQRQRLSILHGKQREAADVNMRMQVREGLVLRMQMILRSVAGEVLASRDPQKNDGLRKLRACEDWTLPGKTASPVKASKPDGPPDLPPLDEDLKILEEVQPAWLGVRYGPEHPGLQTRFGLGAGAVVVRTVFPGSAAEQADIRRGDTLIGRPGKPFEEPGALRELVMLSRPKQQVALEILRRGERKTVRVLLQPFPDALPKMPEKPKVGQPAPPLFGLKPLRGKLPPADSPVLLVFFATWCGPCKAAFGPLIEWEQQHGIPVVLVSNQTDELVEEFLGKWTKPLPGRLALDPRGLVTDAFSAGKYPTFVLISPDRKIQAVQQGFRPQKGFTFSPAPSE